jgi:hypothetical protein
MTTDDGHLETDVEALPVSATSDSIELERAVRELDIPTPSIPSQLERAVRELDIPVTFSEVEQARLEIDAVAASVDSERALACALGEIEIRRAEGSPPDLGGADAPRRLGHRHTRLARSSSGKSSAVVFGFLVGSAVTSTAASLVFKQPPFLLVMTSALVVTMTLRAAGLFLIRRRRPLPVALHPARREPTLGAKRGYLDPAGSSGSPSQYVDVPDQPTDIIADAAFDLDAAVSAMADKEDVLGTVLREIDARNRDRERRETDAELARIAAASVGLHHYDCRDSAGTVPPKAAPEGWWVDLLALSCFLLTVVGSGLLAKGFLSSRFVCVAAAVTLILIITLRACWFIANLYISRREERRVAALDRRALRECDALPQPGR